MLTDTQIEAVEQAGVEVATLRLAGVSKLKPQASIKEYQCLPAPKKCDVEAWLNKKLRRQRNEDIFLGLTATSSVLVMVGGVWELVRFGF